MVAKAVKTKEIVHHVRKGYFYLKTIVCKNVQLVQQVIIKIIVKNVHNNQENNVQNAINFQHVKNVKKDINCKMENVRKNMFKF